MKKHTINSIFFLVLFSLISCVEDGEKFTGLNDDLEVVSLQGDVSTNVTTTLRNQIIDVTASLPSGKTFADVVTIEVSAINKAGGRTRANIDIPAGQSSATGKIVAVGGVLFDTTFDLKLTAISLKTAEIGKRYQISSPTKLISTCVATVPDVNPNALIVRFFWPFPNSTTKNLKLFVDKPSPVSDISVNSLSTDFGKQHTIESEGTTNDLNTSNAIGDYIFKTNTSSPTSLLIQPVDMPYKVFVFFPNGDVKIFEGVYSGLTSSSPLKNILKVNKSSSVVDGVVTYTYTATDQF